MLAPGMRRTAQREMVYNTIVHLGGHCTAVGQLPIRTGIVPTDGLALEDQGGNRFAKLPDQLATAVGLAFIDLGAFGMDGHHRHLARRSNGIGYLRTRA